MRIALALALTVFMSTFAGVKDATAQQACDFYRVQRGDTLNKIVQAAYGDESYQMLYRANAAEIGRNPNIIRVGTVLRMPCLDGSMPERQSNILGRQDNGADAETVSFVTANGYLPYTDESLPGGGIITRLAETAMVRAVPDKNFEVIFVNDWAAHLEELLPRGAFDASFPWTAPNCAARAELSATDRAICDGYVFSNAYFDIVDGYFVRKGSGLEAVGNAEGFFGSTVCRPEGYATSHLEAAGLSEPNIKLVQPVSGTTCFQALARGEVDIVSLDTRAGERLVRELGLDDHVTENAFVTSIQPLQIAVHRSNPDADTIIGDLNEGLEIMLTSGEWASIVQEGLQHQAEALMN